MRLSCFAFTAGLTEYMTITQSAMSPLCWWHELPDWHSYTTNKSYVSAWNRVWSQFLKYSYINFQSLLCTRKNISSSFISNLNAVLPSLMFPCRVSNLIAPINLNSCSCLEFTEAKATTLAHLPVPIPPTPLSSSAADFTLSGDWVTKDLNYTVC